MESRLGSKVNKKAITVDMEVFGALCDIASKHKCGAGDLMGVYLAAGLDSWVPDFQKSMTAIFGKNSEKAINALHLEGWLTQVEPTERGKLGQLGAEDARVETPVDALGRAWSRITGDVIPTLAKKRLYSQMCSQYPGGPVKLPSEAASLYRMLFPEGSFASFVTDAYKFSDSMDKTVAGGVSSDVCPETIARWRRIWAVASKLLPGSKFSSDPYVFFCCAKNPSFNERLFERNLVSYSPWDAMTASIKKVKKQPKPEALSARAKG